MHGLPAAKGVLTVKWVVEHDELCGCCRIAFQVRKEKGEGEGSTIAGAEGVLEARPIPRRFAVAKVNGRMFAGLFGASVMVWLPEDERAEALALKGAAPFDPMGDGRRSDKVMLPERFMRTPAELKRWVTRAFKAAAALPPAAKKKTAKRKPTAKKPTKAKR